MIFRRFVFASFALANPNIVSSRFSRTINSSFTTLKMSAPAKQTLGEYTPEKVWTSKPAEGPFANTPTAGAREEATLEKGKHPIQLYSMATPNGVKVTILLEELCAAYPDFDYDAWIIAINGKQFGSEFVGVNPNSKIPAMVHHPADGSAPIRIFESGAILMYLQENFDKENKFWPTDPSLKAECLSWLFWQIGSAPYLGGGFGHFYNYAPVKIQYAIDRFTMEAKRQLDVLERHLSAKDKKYLNTGSSGGPYLCGEQYTVADMAIYSWYGLLCTQNIYSSKEYLNVEEDYPTVIAWAKKIEERETVNRGRKVNNSWGTLDRQLQNRHCREDFDTVPTAEQAKEIEAKKKAAEEEEEAKK